MLVKEYRICMPLSVEEYRIGQLYMIARHSQEESSNGEGVEVVVNEPCENEERGRGQYTEKRIHLNNRLPYWVQSMLPRVFYIIEKSWNYYPFTVTEYTCSFLPRFQIQIETTYQDNNGSSENALRLPDDILNQREIINVDIGTDLPSSGEPLPDDLDCSKFSSTKTGRGPLKDGWKDSSQPLMCSYKVVKVFFEVWGLQGRVESGVHRAVQDIMLKGHQQAFLWIDDWHGMSLDEVRDYEKRTQEETNRRLTEPNGISEGATP